MLRSHLNQHRMLAVHRVLLRRGPRLHPSPLLLRASLVRTASLFDSASPLSRPSPWSGLQGWRAAPPDGARIWGPHGPCEAPASPPAGGAINGDDPTASSASLAECAALVLSTSDPLAKSRLSHLAFSRWRSGGLPVGAAVAPARPARPSRPLLVSPKEVPPHKTSGLPLNAYMLHNLAHVELNAIDLAWDTVVRFSPFRQELGDEFFSDFAHVADDESRHFAWCSQRLAELGFR